MKGQEDVNLPQGIERKAFLVVGSVLDLLQGDNLVIVVVVIVMVVALVMVVATIVVVTVEVVVGGVPLRIQQINYPSKQLSFGDKNG